MSTNSPVIEELTIEMTVRRVGPQEFQYEFSMPDADAAVDRELAEWLRSHHGADPQAHGLSVAAEARGETDE